MTIEVISYDEIDDLPEVVFKYRNWADNYHKEILTEQIVFMARPTSFEDPLDCKSQKRYDLLTEEQIFNKYYQDSLKLHHNWTEEQHQKFAADGFAQSPMRDKNKIKLLQEKHFKQFDNRFGVLSLTANNLNEAMWTKYSDNHKGFCVGFDTKNMFVHLGGGGHVEYYDQLPDILPFDSFEEENFKQIFAKQSKWTFEQEYRTHRFYKNPIATNDDRRIKLPKDCYKQIIFGSQMAQDHINQIIDTCKEQQLAVDFFKVVNIDNQMSLEKLPSP